MPYLLRTKDNNLLIVNKSKNNDLYYQTLSKKGLSRPNMLYRNINTCYSAVIDNHNICHIIAQNSKKQILRISIKNSNVTRNILLDDSKQSYNFSNIFITLNNNNLNLLYTAKNPNTDNYNLIHHILCEESHFEPCPILSFPNSSINFKHLSINNNIYIIYNDWENKNSLKAIMYKTDKWTEPTSLVKMDFPILNFEFFIDNDENIYIVYVQEKYGRYNMFYKFISSAGKPTEDKLIYNSSSIINPCIFIYNNGLWINFLENNKLKMLLSTNNGDMFSKCVNCSYQNNKWKLFNFINSDSNNEYNFRSLYVSLSNCLDIGIISSIDTIGILPNKSNNNELELLLDGIINTKMASNKSLKKSDNKPSIEKLKLEKEEIIKEYNTMAELTRKIQDEGKKWRDKAKKLETQIEKSEQKKQS